MTDVSAVEAEVKQVSPKMVKLSDGVDAAQVVGLITEVGDVNDNSNKQMQCDGPEVTECVGAELEAPPGGVVHAASAEAGDRLLRSDVCS